MTNPIFPSKCARFHFPIKALSFCFLGIFSALTSNLATAELAINQHISNQIQSTPKLIQLVESMDQESTVVDQRMFNPTLSSQSQSIQSHSERFIKARQQRFPGAELKLRKAVEAAQERSSEGVKTFSVFQ